MILLILPLLLCFLIVKNNKNIMARRISEVLIWLWVILFAVSFTNPYDLYSVSTYIYLLTIAFVSCFVIGITFSFNKQAVQSKESFGVLAKRNLDYFVESKMILILAIVCVVFLSYAVSRQTIALQYESMMDLRNEGSDDYIFGGNRLLGLSYNMFVVPFSYIIHVLFGYCLLYRRDKLLPLIVFLIDAILSTLLNNARGVILTLLVYIFFIFFCCPEFSKNVKKIKQVWSILILLVFSFAAFALVSALTAQRLYGENTLSWDAVMMGLDSMSRHVVTYLVTPLRALEYSFDHDYFSSLGGPSLGQSTFGFFFGFIDLFLERLGLNIKFANEVIYHELQSSWIFVGKEHNFAYTAILNFYMDFGIVGVFIMPVFFGAVIKRVCIMYTQNPSPVVFFLLGFLFKVMVNCYFGWELYYKSCAFFFLILILINHFTKQRFSNCRGIIRKKI